MQRKTNCRHCGKEIVFENFANIIIICPDCKKDFFLECEYGYGPVTPCVIYLGGRKIGMVDTSGGDYILTSRYFGRPIHLKKRYLEALHEARDIMVDRVNR